jgi:hypothetical protein
MTLRSLLTLQMAFLLAGASAPGRPAVLGVVVEAYRAHLGCSAVSWGATVYDGDRFSTEEGGALRLRCNAGLVELTERSAMLVHAVENERRMPKQSWLRAPWVFRQRGRENSKSWRGRRTFVPLGRDERRRR